jgi:hypothetical protein
LSLVLEALRRLEKPDARAGALGVAVASYRPDRRARRSWAPLVLGLMVGAAIVFQFWPAPNTRTETALGTRPLEPRVIPPPGLQEAAQAPSSLVEPTVRSGGGSSPAPDPPAALAPRLGRSTPVRSAQPKTAAPLVLQAISERDSRPIAVISDQLVKEGDLVGGARVLKIGGDSVEVLLASGLKEVVRFLPPPSDPTPSPEER